MVHQDMRVRLQKTSCLYNCDPTFFAHIAKQLAQPFVVVGLFGAMAHKHYRNRMRHHYPVYILACEASVCLAMA